MQYHDTPLVAADEYCTQHSATVFNSMCFSPPQPAIVLAPIHCTQTAEPQVEVSASKPESQASAAQSGSGESPQQGSPADAAPAEDDEHEGKSD